MSNLLQCRNKFHSSRLQVGCDEMQQVIPINCVVLVKWSDFYGKVENRISSFKEYLSLLISKENSTQTLKNPFLFFFFFKEKPFPEPG